MVNPVPVVNNVNEKPKTNKKRTFTEITDYEPQATGTQKSMKLTESPSKSLDINKLNLESSL